VHPSCPLSSEGKEETSLPRRDHKNASSLSMPERKRHLSKKGGESPPHESEPAETYLGENGGKQGRHTRVGRGTPFPYNSQGALKEQLSIEKEHDYVCLLGENDPSLGDWMALPSLEYPRGLGSSV